jgi:hypothetical protein
MSGLELPGGIPLVSTKRYCLALLSLPHGGAANHMNFQAILIALSPVVGQMKRSGRGRSTHLQHRVDDGDFVAEDRETRLSRVLHPQ